MSTAAIYARKSKDTEKGDSMQSQIDRAIDLCRLREWNYIIYEDFDISGKDLDRPAFERMWNDIENGKIQNIICYRLDRISRSVSDFSNLIEELNLMNVGFISLREQFDTSTPMGRAMMYITSVFAQLERETIAERVRDNMIDRFKSGKWNGGPVPFGFDVNRKFIVVDGRKKSVSRLIINEDEAKVVRQFHEWYLEFEGSVRSIVTRANRNGIKTKNNAYWRDNQVSRILKNPLYCQNDSVAYEYYSKSTEVNVVNVEEEFDGTSALMFYNRRKAHKKTTREREQKKWILAIGEHEGIVSGETFVRTQLKLEENSIKAPRTGSSTKSVLSGLVKCGKCNSTMVVCAANGSLKSNEYLTYFRCSKKESILRELCNNRNMRADKLERLVVEQIINLCTNDESIERIFKNLESKTDNKAVEITSKKSELNSSLKNIEKEINNLINALGKGVLPESLIKSKYEELEKDKQSIINELNELNLVANSNIEESYNTDLIKRYLQMFKENYEDFDFDKRKELLNTVIDKITIDDTKVNINLKFIPSEDLGSGVCSHMDKGSSLL